MPRKQEEVKVEEIKKTEHVLVLRARKPLDEVQFKLLSDLVKHEEEKTGVKIVLVPNSVEVVELKEEAAGKQEVE